VAGRRGQPLTGGRANSRPADALAWASGTGDNGAAGLPSATYAGSAGGLAGPHGSLIMSTDILTDPFERTQAAVAAWFEEVLDACRLKDFDRLVAYHLAGPEFSKFDDAEPLDRQDAETGMRAEARASAPSTTSTAASAHRGAKWHAAALAT
jgi:hypothetical protein